MLIIIITLNINFWLKYLTPIDKLSKPAPTPPTNRSRYFRTQRDRPYIDTDIKGIALLLPQINVDERSAIALTCELYRASLAETVSRIGGQAQECYP